MPRTNRIAPGGWVFHVLNRGNARGELFEDAGDYLAFEAVLGETVERLATRLLAYCIMPNHWHMVVWPREDGDLGRFMQRLTVTHATRWQKHYNRVGYGHVYQNRFKSFPVETDDYFYQVSRYVERNALRAHLVSTAQAWKWGSLWIRQHGSAEHRAMLSKWPVPLPQKWIQYVNQPASEAELKALRKSSVRGTPYGSPDWVIQTAKKLGLESTLRLPGRPKKR